MTGELSPALQLKDFQARLTLNGFSGADRDILDRIIRVSDEDAYMMSRLVAGTDGVLVGISSGAASHISAGIPAARSDMTPRYMAGGLIRTGMPSSRSI